MNNKKYINNHIDNLLDTVQAIKANYLQDSCYVAQIKRQVDICKQELELIESNILLELKVHN